MDCQLSISDKFWVDGIFFGFVYLSFRLPIIAQPGGMRGAIKSAAHVVDMSWRVEPKPKATSSNSSLQISDPLKISPSGPAHSARPTQNVQQADFCDFHFARHWPSQMQKNYAGWNRLRICIKIASFKMPLS